MKFSEAEKALKAGKKIKLPKWEKAYWYMNQDGELINILRKVRNFRLLHSSPVT